MTRHGSILAHGERVGRTRLITSLAVTAGIVVLSASPLASSASASAATALSGSAAKGAGTGTGPGTATVFAGGLGGPGLGRAFALPGPCGLASSGGEVIFGQGQTMVRALNPRTGWMRNIGGIGLPGLEGVGGPALLAELDDSCSLTVDHHGNEILSDAGSAPVPHGLLVIAKQSGEWYDQRMRAGHLYQLPVSGASAAVDYAGNLVQAEIGAQENSSTIQVLAVSQGEFYGQQMVQGNVYQIAQSKTPLKVVATDAAGNPVIEVNGAITVIAARSGTFDGRRMQAGHSYQLGQGVSGPAAVDQNGNFVLIDQVTQYVQQLDVLATRAGTFYGRAMRPGHLYKFTRPAAGLSPNGGPLSKAKFFQAVGVTVDASGNWVLADGGNNQVRVVATKTGRFYGIAMRAMHVYRVAGNGSFHLDSGDGGPATRAELGLSAPTFSAPPVNFYGVSADQHSNVYLADTPNDRVQMIPGHNGTFFGQRMRAGDIYTIAGNGIRGDAADGTLGTKAELGYPFGLTSDRAGNVLFTDKVGKIRVLAARAGTFYGIKMKADRLYTIAGGGTQVPASGISATAVEILPIDVKVDGHGNVVISDQAFGVWVMPVTSGTFYGQAMTAGDYYNIGSVPIPSGLAVDQAGNLLVGSYSHNVVQVIAAHSGEFYGQQMTEGNTYTIAGGGHLHGPGNLAALAAIGHPEGVALDHAGDLIITISGIRKLVQVVPARTGLFLGKQLTAGHLYTIAGGGFATVPGNRPSTSMKVLSPQGVAVLPSGDVIFYVPSEGRVFRIRAS
ncbi:MAG TPA: hypothetical protein VFI65_14485 [Streptosporangiaceae bacterium]|nr:hypothetical protein [Streptosporangiaceae bacterium]